MDITQSKGNIVELQCLSAFMELGYECSIPYGNGAKYDFIVDYNGELLRIQCKSSTHPMRKGVLDVGAFQFSTCSQTTNTSKTTRHKYDSTQIDYFATFFQGNVYIIPVDECSTSKTLRLTPPNNGQIYNKAEDYLISNFFKTKFEKIDKKIIQDEKFICSICNKEIVSKQGGICHKCSSIKQRIVERPTREELKNLIRTKSFLEIGKIYNVSDNAVRRWCDAENLPRKKTEIKNISDLDWEKI